MEPVFLAASTREVDFVERLLLTEGMAYSMRPEPVLRADDSSRVCLEGVLFSVSPAVAARSRQLLVEADLARGLIAAPAGA
jgi:hypothetical protein